MEDLVKEETKDRLDQILEDITKRFAGAPDRAQINGWKQRFGTVSFVYLDEDAVAFVRPLKFGEMSRLRQTAQTAGGEDPESFEKDLMVGHCTLWPKVDNAKIIDMRAGQIETLYNKILQISDFSTYTIYNPKNQENQEEFFSQLGVALKDNAITKADFDQIVDKHQDPHIVLINNTIYVAKPIKTKAYRDLQRRFQSGDLTAVDLSIELLKKCLLKPSLISESTDIDEFKAGTIETLSTAIMEMSYFRSPEQTATYSLDI